MASNDQKGSAASTPAVALIVGVGPGISASCVRLFAQSGMAVAVAAPQPGQADSAHLVAICDAQHRGHRIRTVGGPVHA